MQYINPTRANGPCKYREYVNIQYQNMLPISLKINKRVAQWPSIV